jgi:NADH:ubiquinone oxidoreductase subunit H
MQGESILINLFYINFFAALLFLVTYIYTQIIIYIWYFVQLYLISYFNFGNIEYFISIIDEQIISDLFIMWFQIISLGVLTIWARGVGPRFRPDQMSEITWKDILIYLTGIFLIVSYIVLLG